MRQAGRQAQWPDSSASASGLQNLGRATRRCSTHREHRVGLRGVSCRVDWLVAWHAAPILRQRRQQASSRDGRARARQSARPSGHPQTVRLAAGQLSAHTWWRKL